MATRIEQKTPDAKAVDDYIASMLDGMAEMAEKAGSDYAYKLRAIDQKAAPCRCQRGTNGSALAS